MEDTEGTYWCFTVCFYYALKQYGEHWGKLRTQFATNKRWCTLSGSNGRKLKDICKACIFLSEHSNPPNNLIILYGCIIFAWKYLPKVNAWINAYRGSHKTEIISPKSEDTFEHNSMTSSPWLVPRFGLHYLRLTKYNKFKPWNIEILLLQCWTDGKHNAAKSIIFWFRS